MKHARIRHQGQGFNVTIDEQHRVCLPNGSKIPADEVQWLPPLKARYSR